MTFIKEIMLALLILALITFGIYSYYSNWEPVFFFEAAGWVLEPKENDLVFIEKVSWLKTDHAAKVKNYFPEITTPPDKEAFLFILQETNQKNDTTPAKAVSAEKTPPDARVVYYCTLVCKNGPVLNWKTENPKFEELYKLGTHRELEQPVAGIAIQLLTQKPWRNLKIPSWSEIKELTTKKQDAPETDSLTRRLVNFIF